ncbi:MAG: amylo-alpha-1,6-glucosidase, partial [Lentisphaeria bacterium]
ESAPYVEALKLEDKGYSVIPNGGTFRDLRKELKFIIQELGCKIIHLLPINPTPTVYGKMGVFGSPYAALDFTAVDPALAQFDRSATPLEQFIELVDDIHLLNGKIFIDIAINHTGWAAKVHEEHPEWLVRGSDGMIKSPGAWGVTWGDLTELNHSRLDLWQYLAKVFLVWCERGVDGFRCDAGYMIPAKAWRYIIARVRNHYPDTIFLLEGLGGDLRITEDLLNYSNMNWAYSELFQNYSKDEIQNYINYANRISNSDGLMFHYAETHDNRRLASVSKSFSRLRTGLCAMLSSCGAFGITNGVEWYASQKVDVHLDCGLNWGAEDNQVKYLHRINSILRCHSAFHAGAKIEFLSTQNSNVIAFVRTSKDEKQRLLILANLDTNNSQHASFEYDDLSLGGQRINMLSDEFKMLVAISNTNMVCPLAAGEVACFAENESDAEEFVANLDFMKRKYDPIRWQWAKGLVMDYLYHQNNSLEVDPDVIDEYANLILESPTDFVKRVANTTELKYVHWETPRDLNRIVMVPPDHSLFITHSSRFRAKLKDQNGRIRLLDSLQMNNGSHFVIFSNFHKYTEQEIQKLSLTLYVDGRFCRQEASLLMLPDGNDLVPSSFDNHDIILHKHIYLGVNMRGGMCHIPVSWGELYSKYDALLAANLDNNYLVDRHIMFTRLRCWINHQGYSHALDLESLERFMKTIDGDGIWKFKVPVGNGQFVIINLKLRMDKKEDRIFICIERECCSNDPTVLEDTTKIRIIMRPDIEDRSFHQDTKVRFGIQDYWPLIVGGIDGNMTFAPAQDRILKIQVANAKFHRSDEWYYDIYHKVENSRGLCDKSDLFSPGYFDVKIEGGESTLLTAGINCSVDVECDKEFLERKINNFEHLLRTSMDQFIVNRDNLKSVIAGFPWFLDWGRDTLICVRGMISAGHLDDLKNESGMLFDVLSILKAFARFEEDGTLPNMIHGNNAANRDTSDAPLWFFVAVKDFCNVVGNYELLNIKPDGASRTIQEIMISIAEHYISGTRNGILVDLDSMLVYSPSHFTWMDTNYPAGTPRQGYPIEIQALWYTSLEFLGVITKEEKWFTKAKKVKESIKKYYCISTLVGLSDCLHCDNGFVPANKAIADDAIRCNQLLAVTLGAIDDLQLMKNIVNGTRQLLVPGAIRTLADKKVSYHLPVYSMRGELLNDPSNPFWSSYEGDEDYRRKPAYHNGTAWTWPFPSWVEAYCMVYGEAGYKTARAILCSGKYLFKHGCIGQLPEIIDGGYPHKQRGCDAQAWGCTEFFRIWKMLKKEKQ